MKLLTVSLLSGFVASAIAADCSGAAGSLPSDLLHAYWDARTQMCSNSNCAYQQDCQIQTSASNDNGKISVTLRRSKTGETNGFKNCYDGTNDIINQCVYGTSNMNGQWQYGGETYTLESSFEASSAPPPPPAPPSPPPAPSCDVAKYCAYTYNNNNCAITTWKCDCEVPVFHECWADAGCAGAKCVNGLCCHADRLPGGEAQCPTVTDLQLCGKYYRQPGPGGSGAYVPPETDIPSELKCGC